ncbi:MAG: hypothetical protein AAF478_03155 [Pseudomonadota bacterium]
MSTIGYDSWAVDLAEVGAIYPFQGTETLLMIVGIALWLIWHVVQAKAENAELSEKERDFDKESAGKSIERY